jgi:hypothetical protein
MVFSRAHVLITSSNLTRCVDDIPQFFKSSDKRITEKYSIHDWTSIICTLSMVKYNIKSNLNREPVIAEKYDNAQCKTFQSNVHSCYICPYGNVIISFKTK